MRALLILFAALAITGCKMIDSGTDAITTALHAGDPTERGMAYIAMALILSALIRGLMNK